MDPPFEKKHYDEEAHASKAVAAASFQRGYVWEVKSRKWVVGRTSWIRVPRKPVNVGYGLP